MHRRTALSVSAALLVAAPLLSACSGQPRPGTAAVVGGERITTSALQAQVSDVRAAQNGSARPAELIAGTPGLERAKLSVMLQSRILDRMAATAGVTVSTKEIEEEHTKYAEGNGGPERFGELLLEKAAVTPGQTDRYLRDRVLIAKLTTRYGNAGLAAPAAAAAKELRIEVNPRYGAWNAQEINLGAAKTPWILQRTQPGQEPPAGV
ncbi:SurA N-terminal domain-containing protein [Streptomyces sp. NPDC051567]|uniref:SurA N-terminal domain-containing protein n=1 Tax=Streptomyces sp. NPDC051567 TaxID=3365660 RepID=UPI0037B9D7E0